jgi:60 kDa SS-A/Ro ribonucleoprotein
MSKLSEYAVKSKTEIRKYEDLVVENFMGGSSYKLSPLQTLKIVAASSIFGEPQYYRDGIKKQASIKNHDTLLKYSIFAGLIDGCTSAADVFTNAIDAALDYDFKGTLDLATELRMVFFMRLNPAVIFIRASVHQKRAEFNESNPGYMKTVGKSIALRPDDLTNQFEYFMYVNKSKNKLSSIVKRTWAERLGEYSRYQLNKYKGKSLIDLVRISHAWNNDIDELMKTGSIKVEESERTWENLRSEGKTWKEILETIEIPHMALLRNLRGIFKEIEDLEIARSVMTKLSAGVTKGNQFPFRYWSAYKAVEKEEINHKGIILDGLEECMDISVLNMPKLDGKTICLSDNSGSAWGQLSSEYGTVYAAEIANLSSLITGKQSDEGEIGLFGDRLIVESVSKRNGLLSQLKAINEVERDHGKLGGGTENGIWLFFDDAIKNKKHYDNIFIYSDMQAGHGGLYGTDSSEYKDFLHGDWRHIDVLALVSKYRKDVNPKVNLFSVQVAGYDNAALPENLYRGAILAGWTGKEPVFAKALIDTWNEIENQ